MLQMVVHFVLGCCSRHRSRQTKNIIGALCHGKVNKPRDIVDGLSNTLMFGEVGGTADLTQNRNEGDEDISGIWLDRPLDIMVTLRAHDIRTMVQTLTEEEESVGLRMWGSNRLCYG